MLKHFDMGFFLGIDMVYDMGFCIGFDMGFDLGFDINVYMCASNSDNFTWASLKVFSQLLRT